MSLEAPTRSIKANKFQMQLYADAALLRKDITIHETARKADPNRVSEHTIKQKKYELTQIEHRIKNVNPASVTSQCEKYFAENTEFFNRDTIIAETQRMLEHGQSVNEWPHLAAVFLLDIKYIQNATVTALAATVAPVAPVVKPDDFEALVSTMPKVTISGLSGEQYKNLTPEYDKTKNAIFIPLRYTGGNFIGIYTRDFIAGTPVQMDVEIERDKYTITIIPNTNTSPPSLTVAATLMPATAAKPAASAVAASAAPVAAAPVAPAAKEKKLGRTPAQVITGNQKFITENDTIIATAILRASSEKKIKMTALITNPTNQNIRAFQSEIGAGEDGDFRAQTLAKLKEWAGVDIDKQSGTLPEAKVGDDVSLYIKKLGDNGYAHNSLKHEESKGIVTDVYTKKDSPDIIITHKDGKIIAPAAKPDDLETLVSTMPKVTISGLSGEQYKNLTPEYDKTKNAIFIPLRYTGGNFIGIYTIDFIAGTSVKMDVEIERDKYTITIIPNTNTSPPSLTVAAMPILATAAKPVAVAVAASAAPVAAAPVAPVAKEKKLGRTPEQVITENQKFIADNNSIIDTALSKASGAKGVQMNEWIESPTNTHIRALQSEIGAGEDGDFRAQTLAKLKEWAGVDIDKQSGTLPEAKVGDDVSLYIKKLGDNGYAHNSLKHEESKGIVTDVYTKKDSPDIIITHKDGKIIAPAAKPDDLETLVSKMLRVTISGLSGDKYQNLKPEYDKNKKAIFIPLKYTGGDFIGIYEKAFIAGTSVKMDVEIERDKYTITIIPNNNPPPPSLTVAATLMPATAAKPAASAAKPAASAAPPASAPPASAAASAPVAKPAPTPAPAVRPKEIQTSVQIHKYLKQNGYTPQDDGSYINKDTDFTITIKQDKVEGTRAFRRAFGSWKLNDQEDLILLQVAKIIVEGPEYKAKIAKVDAYLKGEKYIKQADGSYSNSATNFKIQIKDGLVSIVSQFQNDKQRVQVLEVAKLLK